ncbi:hypothetical protein FA15DRAFT_661630 [Coprinopsis marcescibilis]|uniref:Restriction of telomere capping protein 4 C-terminal domain-containing protein n=1 Tax=Coprinopsis marcescibilis TaxID=230819 RepID=A0A5C3KAT9_COPMA|nr:hypothetical protein FA15DRAFT_661630 [Coprinopsis marcescibilis]
MQQDCSSCPFSDKLVCGCDASCTCGIFVNIRDLLGSVEVDGRAVGKRDGKPDYEFRHVSFFAQVVSVRKCSQEDKGLEPVYVFELTNDSLGDIIIGGLHCDSGWEEYLRWFIPTDGNLAMSVVRGEVKYHNGLPVVHIKAISYLDSYKELYSQGSRKQSLLKNMAYRHQDFKLKCRWCHPEDQHFTYYPLYTHLERLVQQRTMLVESRAPLVDILRANCLVCLGITKQNARHDCVVTFNRNGWPLHPDFETLASRVFELSREIDAFVVGKESVVDSVVHNELADMPIGRKPTLHAGYYGNLGAYIIGSCLTLIVGRTVIEIKDTPLAGLAFQQFFLLPWVATRLISEDLGLDFDQAHKAMLRSMQVFHRFLSTCRHLCYDVHGGPNPQLYSLASTPGQQSSDFHECGWPGDSNEHYQNCVVSIVQIVIPHCTVPLDLHRNRRGDFECPFCREMISSAADLQLMHPAQCHTWRVLDWPADDWKKWGSSWREIDTRYPSGPPKRLPHPSPNSMQWYDYLCVTTSSPSLENVWYGAGASTSNERDPQGPTPALSPGLSYADTQGPTPALSPAFSYVDTQGPTPALSPGISASFHRQQILPSIRISYPTTSA